MVKGAAEVHAMFRRKAAAVVKAGRDAAKQGGDEVASAMRYLAPRKEGDLIKSIRTEDVGSIRLSGAKKGAYASRKGNQSYSNGTNRTANFIGVMVIAGDSTTLVKGARNTMFQNARIQEHGTKNMPANPFFYPAWRSNRTRVKSKITTSVRKAWQNG